MQHKKLALKNYKKFYGRKVEKETAINFTMPKALTFLGNAKAIEYMSDKKISGTKRKGRLFRHLFGNGVKIYLHPGRKWLLVGGGNFRVTDWLRG